MAFDEKTLNERAAILSRYRSLLVEQRDKFSNYLNVLDSQKKSLLELNSRELKEHIELEEKITGDIISLQKCIEPMRLMVKSAQGDKPSDIDDLNEALVFLQKQAAERLQENKKLVEERMRILKGEIKNLRSNPFKKTMRNVYSTQNSSLLDISG